MTQTYSRLPKHMCYTLNWKGNPDMDSYHEYPPLFGAYFGSQHLPSIDPIGRPSSFWAEFDSENRIPDSNRDPISQWVDKCFPEFTLYIQWRTDQIIALDEFEVTMGFHSVDVLNAGKVHSMILKPNGNYEYTTEQVVTRLLPPPYDTNCVHYEKLGEHPAYPAFMTQTVSTASCPHLGQPLTQFRNVGSFVLKYNIYKLKKGDGLYWNVSKLNERQYFSFAILNVNGRSPGKCATALRQDIPSGTNSTRTPAVSRSQVLFPWIR